MEHKVSILRHNQIMEQAKMRSEMCSSQLKDIYRIVFREGAEWADETRDNESKRYFLPSSPIIKVRRDDENKMTDEFRKWLIDYIGNNYCCIAKDEDDGEVYLLDPNSCIENDYQILNDCETLNELIVIKIA